MWPPVPPPSRGFSAAALPEGEGAAVSFCHRLPLPDTPEHSQAWEKDLRWRARLLPHARIAGSFHTFSLHLHRSTTEMTSGPCTSASTPGHGWGATAARPGHSAGWLLPSCGTRGNSPTPHSIVRGFSSTNDGRQPTRNTRAGEPEPVSTSGSPACSGYPHRNATSECSTCTPASES
jgi:hypothetical protein